MKPVLTAVSLPEKTKTGERVVSDRRYRIFLSAAAAFVFHLLYAVYHCILGITNLSPWFIAMSAFYGILAAMRFSAVLCEYKKQNAASDNMEKYIMKLSGILLSALSLVLAAVNYISLSQNIAARYSEIIMITIAAYTFYKITAAVIRAVKQHQNPSPLLKALRCITYAEVAASVLTLQRSMLVSFGSMDSGQIRLMNSATGAAVCLFVLVLGISMMIKSSGKDN